MKQPELEHCYYGEFSKNTIYILQVEPYIIIISNKRHLKGEIINEFYTYSISKSGWEQYSKYVEISKEKCIENFLEE